MPDPRSQRLDRRASAALRMIRGLRRDPGEWDPTDLDFLRQLEEEIALTRVAVVYGLRDSGHTDGQIAAALGVSQQAVSKRWPGDGRYVGAAGRYRTNRTPIKE